MYEVRNNQLIRKGMPIKFVYARFIWRLFNAGEIVILEIPFGGMIRKQSTAQMFFDLPLLDRNDVWALLFDANTHCGSMN